MLSLSLSLSLSFILQNGFTPLHIAAKYGNQNVAGVLVQHGATIDYKTKVRCTVLTIDLVGYCFNKSHSEAQTKIQML